MNSLSTTFKALMETVMSASSTRYKATLHFGSNRPTTATVSYVNTGLGELSTTSGNTYVAGSSNLTSGGVPLTSVLSAGSMTFNTLTLTTATGETLGPVDTIAIWDTSTVNGVTCGLVGLIDLQYYLNVGCSATNGSNVVTCPIAANFSIGMPVISNTKFANGTVITAISGTTVTVSNPYTGTTGVGNVGIGFGFVPTTGYAAQAAGNGGAFTVDFAAATITFIIA